MIIGPIEMKLNQLQYLVVVAREGSFSRAADALSVAQPAISQQIRALELDLDTQLFHRTQKGVTLTKSGRILNEHAERILNRIEIARVDIASQSDEVRGEVSLHVSNAMASRLVPLLVAELDALYPGIHLHVTPLPSQKVHLNIQNGRADLGVLPDRATLSKVNAKTFSQEPLYFLCDPSHPVAGVLSNTIKLADAVEHTLAIVQEDQPFREFFDDAISEAGLSYKARYESNELLMIFSHVNSGYACSILPRCAVLEKMEAGTIVARPIVEPEVIQEYLVVWPKSLPLTRASVCVRDIVVRLGQEGLG